MDAVCRDPENVGVAQYMHRFMIQKRICPFSQTSTLLIHLENGLGRGISHSKVFNFWVFPLCGWSGWGGGATKGSFQLYLCVKTGQAEVGGEERPLLGQGARSPSDLCALHHMRTHTQSCPSRDSDLTLGGPRP